MRIAEIGFEVDAVKLIVAGKLGSVVEGDGFAEAVWQWLQEGEKRLGGWDGGLVWRPCGKKNAGVPVVQGEDGLAIFGEQHAIGFPVPRVAAVFNVLWP